MTCRPLPLSVLFLSYRYVQKVNPAQTPAVVGALLDSEAEEGFIKALILSVRSLLPVGPLVEEVEKRNRLKLLQPFLDHLMQEGSQDPQARAGALGTLAHKPNTLHSPLRCFCAG